MAKTTRRSGRVVAANGDVSARGGESLSSYFHKIFAENPRWVRSRSNKALLKRWLADHPGETEMPPRVKASLFNVKSLLRRKRQRRRRTEDAAAAAPERASMSRSAVRDLQGLEENIDECLILARSIDRVSLETVINHLRRARNEVVLRAGMGPG